MSTLEGEFVFATHRTIEKEQSKGKYRPMTDQIADSGTTSPDKLRRFIYAELDKVERPDGQQQR